MFNFRSILQSNWAVRITQADFTILWHTNMTPTNTQICFVNRDKPCRTLQSIKNMCIYFFKTNALHLLTLTLNAVLSQCRLFFRLTDISASNATSSTLFSTVVLNFKGNIQILKILSKRAKKQKPLKSSQPLNELLTLWINGEKPSSFTKVRISCLFRSNIITSNLISAEIMVTKSMKLNHYSSIPTFQKRLK